MIQPASKFALLARSPYAARLRKGVAGLHFPGDLEAAFRQAHLCRVRDRVRIWQVFTLLLALATVLSRLGEAGGALPVVETVVRFGVLLPCSVALVWAAWSSRYERAYPLALAYAIPVYYLASTALAAGLVAYGRVEALVLPLVHIVAAYFLIGMLFRQAGSASLLVVSTYFGAALAFGMPVTTAFHHGALLLVTGLFAAAIQYRHEKASRLDFLEQSLTVELTERDPLTGLKNRRTFDEHLQRLWQEAMRERQWISLIVLDIDGFSRLNERRGRDAGDEGLRKIAQLLQERAGRPLDIVARYGDDELALVLRHRSPDYACIAGEQLRRAVESLAITRDNSGPGSADGGSVCTVSIGVTAVRPSLGRSLQETVQTVERALHGAKNEGGNRVRFLQEADHDAFMAAGFLGCR